MVGGEKKNINSQILGVRIVTSKNKSERNNPELSAVDGELFQEKAQSDEIGVKFTASNPEQTLKLQDPWQGHSS